MWWVGKKKPQASTQEELEEDRRRKQKAIGWAVEIIRDTPALLYSLPRDISDVYRWPPNQRPKREDWTIVLSSIRVLFLCFLTQKKKKRYDKQLAICKCPCQYIILDEERERRRRNKIGCRTHFPLFHTGAHFFPSQQKKKTNWFSWTCQPAWHWSPLWDRKNKRRENNNKIKKKGSGD